VDGGTLLSLIVTPAALACSARTVAIDTMPVAAGEVVRVTVRFECPAFFSRDLAWAISVSRRSE